jgi:hypothetical protein
VANVVDGKAEIAEHVQKITLIPEGRTFVTSGTWDLLGVAAWMVPGAPDSTTRAFEFSLPPVA